MFDGNTFTHKRVDYVAEIHYDDHHGAPWDEEDGHGPVSDWTRRDKAPGELVLCEDRGSRRFYDFAEACKIARRDGWGFLPYRLEIRPDDESRPPYVACGGWALAGPFKAYAPDNFNRAIAAVYDQHRATMTPRQYAAGAAMADYDRLRRWCNDDWHYCGVVVRRADDCGACGESASLWGIESDAGDYLEEVARELAEDFA